MAIKLDLLPEHHSQGHAALLQQVNQYRPHALQIVRPLYQPVRLVGRHHHVRAHLEAALPRLRLLAEHPVEQAAKVHEPTIVSEVILRLGEEGVEFAVGAAEGDSFGFDQGDHHLDLVFNAYIENLFTIIKATLF